MYVTAKNAPFISKDCSKTEQDNISMNGRSKGDAASPYWSAFSVLTLKSMNDFQNENENILSVILS